MKTLDTGSLITHHSSLKMFLTNKSAIGISINPNIIALSQVRSSIAGFVLEKLCFAPTPPDSVSNGMITDADSLLSAIEDFLKSNNIKLKKSYASVSGPNVIMQLTSLPRMSPSEMREALKAEVESYAILVGSDSVMDFQPLESAEEDTNSKQNVLISALQKEHSNTYAKLFTSAGTSLDCLENAPIAAMRAFIDAEMFGDDAGSGVALSRQKAADSVGEQAVMLLIVDAENTYAIGIQGGTIFFVHTIDFGSVWLYENEKHPDEFVQEIQLCLNYCEADFRNISFQKLILIADGDDTEQIRSYLEEDSSTDISTVELASPFKNISQIKADVSAADSYSLSAAVATGLAMRGAGTGHFLKRNQTAQHFFQINLNLLPFELVETNRIKRQLIKFAACAVLILGILIGINFSVKSKLGALKTRMLNTEREMTIIDRKSVRGVSDVQKEIESLKTDIKNCSDYLKTYQPTECNKLVQAVSYLMPEDAWLSEVRMNIRGTATFIGYSLSEESPFKLLDLIKMSDYFDFYDISIEKTQLDGQRVVEFQINCKLDEK